MVYILPLHGVFVDSLCSTEDMDELFNHYKTNKGKYYQLCLNKWELSSDPEQLTQNFKRE